MCVCVYNMLFIISIFNEDYEYTHAQANNLRMKKKFVTLENRMLDISKVHVLSLADSISENNAVDNRTE